MIDLSAHVPGRDPEDLLGFHTGALVVGPLQPVPVPDIERLAIVVDRDRLQWTDYKGARVKPQEVFWVSAWYVGAEINHLKIELQ